MKLRKSSEDQLLKVVRGQMALFGLAGVLMIGACSNTNQSKGFSSDMFKFWKDDQPKTEQVSTTDQPETAETKLISFVLNAAPGTTALVNEPLLGGDVSITVDRQYYSAAGINCRRFFVNNRALDNQRNQHAVCHIDDQWQLVAPNKPRQ